MSLGRAGMRSNGDGRRGSPSEAEEVVDEAVKDIGYGL